MKPKQAKDDVGLFREAVRDVKPLGKRGEPSAKSAPPRRRVPRQNAAASFEENTVPGLDEPQPEGRDELSFRRPGVQISVLRRLRRGEYRIQSEIDLHGLTAAVAGRVLREFLAEAVHRGTRCVRVVHGKGLRSGDRGPVLKREVNSLLRRSAAVVAFVSARQEDGGTGATYVLLTN